MSSKITITFETTQFDGLLLSETDKADLIYQQINEGTLDLGNTDQVADIEVSVFHHANSL